MASNRASASSSASSASAVRALALELKSLVEDPLEGIRTRLVKEEDLFEWDVALFGPPDTLYQGGYFKVSPVDETRLLIEVIGMPWLRSFTTHQATEVPPK